MAVMPQALGYVSLPGEADEQAVTGAGQELVAFAAEEGYALAGVYWDVRGRTESGVYQLVEAVRRGDAVAVVVPDLEHLRHCGCLTGADIAIASRYLRARLLAVRSHPRR